MCNKEYEIGTPEYYQRREIEHKEVLKALVNEWSKMRMALLIIAEFREPTRNFQVNYGSNGMRDHFISIAKEALE